MVQASDLGAIANQSRTLYRGHVNTNIQALASHHFGSSAPDPVYPGVIWFDSGSNLIKVRDASNTSWYTAGTIGSSDYTWTNLPPYPETYKTGFMLPTLSNPSDGTWPTGWVLMDGGTIGDASSTSTTRANADCVNLFTLIWNNINHSYITLYTSGGVATGFGGSASSDWAAHRRLSLPQTNARVFGSSGSGRVLGEVAGADSTNVTLALGNMPAHNHFVQEYAGTESSGQHVSSSLTGAQSGTHTSTVGSGTPFSVAIVQPTIWLNWMIKL